MVRPYEGRIVAGVAQGVANHFNLHPWLVRIAAIILIPVGGIGLLLYLAGWLLIPEEGASQSLAERALASLRGSWAWVGLALIVVAGVSILASTNLVSAGVAWAIALLAVGVLLYRGRLPIGDSVVASGHTEGPGDRGDEEPVEASHEVPATIVGPITEPPPGEPAGPAPPRPKRPPRPRSVLGRLIMGSLLVTLGVMALLDATGSTRPAFRHYAAAAVLVVGVGLLMGSVVGRSRGAIVLGLLLLPPLFVSSAVTAPFRGGFGDPSFHPRSAAAIASPYRLTAGELTLNLRDIHLTDGEIREVVATVGAGNLVLFVPTDVGLDITAHVGFGEVTLLGTDAGGVDVERRAVLPGSATLVIDLDVGFGAIEVIRPEIQRG